IRTPNSGASASQGGFAARKKRPTGTSQTAATHPSKNISWTQSRNGSFDQRTSSLPAAVSWNATRNACAAWPTTYNPTVMTARPLITNRMAFPADPTYDANMDHLEGKT